MRQNPFVKSGIGALEMKLCELLDKTPLEIGESRRKDPLGISFLEQRIIYEAQEKEKSYKEMERKSKSKGKRK